MAQYKKEILIDYNAKKEVLSLTKPIQKKFELLINELRTFGNLRYPDGKKLSNFDLFEMRIKKGEIYRGIYCYQEDYIVILSFFKKKSQRTPQNEIQKALKRKYKINQ
jgi:phage-related protein